MTVAAGDTQTLGSDGRFCSVDNFAILDVTPQLQGLLLGFFLFTADVGDDVVHHFGPSFEGLACAGNGLIGADQGGIQAEFLQGVQSRNIALQTAVGLDGDEAPLGAQTLALRGDDFDMVCIDFRHNHGDVLSPAMGGIVGNHRALQLGVALLQGFDLILFHIHGAEYEIDHGGDFFCISLSVHHHHGSGGLGHGLFHGPAGSDGVTVGFPRAAGAGSQNGQLKPGVNAVQTHETLSDHAGCANDADFVFLHVYRSNLNDPGKALCRLAEFTRFNLPLYTLQKHLSVKYA